MTALLTANIGGIDELIKPCEQSKQAEYHAYTESNLPYPLPNLNNRLKGKYLKINTHRFLNHNEFVWMDGRTEVISPDFIHFMTDPLKYYDVVIPYHGQRKNVYEEIHFIETMRKEKREYITTRYAGEPFADEEAFYKKEGLPKEYPLFACGLFARKNTEGINRTFEDWWLKTQEFTLFDQAMFSYIAWKRNLNVYSFPYEEALKYVNVGKHKQLI